MIKTINSLFWLKIILPSFRTNHKYAEYSPILHIQLNSLELS